MSREPTAAARAAGAMRAARPVIGEATRRVCVHACDARRRALINARALVAYCRETRTRTAAAAAALSLLVYCLTCTRDARRQMRSARRICALPLRWCSAAEELARRAIYGDYLDTPPETPTFIGAAERTVRSATLRWKVKPVPRYSRETYEVEIALVSALAATKALISALAAHTVAAGAANGAEAAEDGDTWRRCEQMGAAGAGDHLGRHVDELTAGAEYVARVRARNSCGSSEWRYGKFRTKQVPVDGGGQGDGYTWRQTADEIIGVVAVGAEVRARHVRVECRGGRLRAYVAGRDAPLLDGELFGEVIPVLSSSS